VLLARVFVEEFNDEYHADKVLSETAEERIRTAVWRGNVRELRNVVQRAYIMSDDWIAIDDASGLPVVDAGPPGVDGSFDGRRIAVEVGATLAEIERQAILATLSFCRENKRETARTLGISLKTLYTRLALYKGLDRRSGESLDTGTHSR
jgi:DNA-binding NtrC family response regulator